MCIDTILSVIAALIYGGILGLERQISQKPTGFRTIMLIVLGSCVFVLSTKVFPLDSQARIIANLITGIGFLGAGSIMKRSKVKGTTTAATIWVSAAIGVLTGLGQHLLAFTVTVLVLVVLLIGRYE